MPIRLENAAQTKHHPGAKDVPWVSGFCPAQGLYNGTKRSSSKTAAPRIEANNGRNENRVGEKK